MRFLATRDLKALEKWVDEESGIVLFSRGRAWSGTAQSDLEPIEWSNDSLNETQVEITTSGIEIPPFRLLHTRAGEEDLPDVIAYEAYGKPKTLASPYGQTDSNSPAIVYRRLGSGQTLSLGLAKLWNWVFNGKTEFDNNLYDLFWDQLVLWLLANDGVSPGSDYALQANTANLPLGDPITFTLHYNGKDPLPGPPTIRLTQDGNEAAILSPTSDPTDESASITFTPRTPGRYQAETVLPDGRKLKARFLVYREQLERTETAVDIAYLQQLATASGGRIIQASEIKDLVNDLLLESAPMEARTRLIPIWDTALVCLLLTFLLALEWFLRRRWGLT